MLNNITFIFKTPVEFCFEVRQKTHTRMLYSYSLLWGQRIKLCFVSKNLRHWSKTVWALDSGCPEKSRRTVFQWKILLCFSGGYCCAWFLCCCKIQCRLRCLLGDLLHWAVREWSIILLH